MISFDELKRTFQSKEDFFNGAKLSDSEKQEFESSFLCEPNNQGSFYVWKDGEGWDSTSGGGFS
ncbi:hypothetical protein HF1_03450 [Mycoplasma haemofelis str. Langford 1]|uniref:Uncharacterized protein n=1 Tax=Mycoplasma haemofelis (strain Langford 1) TaxID=941640 RepID=E8ZGT2_MYCHL|nr:hypothetical protein [Mycoplasma haemofelis]CBY92353.1 hypothetical protein HF1_03450 [Mycoplasma haemofelis str. Langford 1]